MFDSWLVYNGAAAAAGIDNPTVYNDALYTVNIGHIIHCGLHSSAPPLHVVFIFIQQK